MSGGHGSSRRRSYGKRQRDLRDRPSLDLAVDLDGPATWPRGGSWDAGAASRGSTRTGFDPQRPGGPS